MSKGSGYALRDMYKPGMSELEVLLYQMDQLISEHSSELANHFNAQGFATSTFASRWFLTLFSAVFPKVCPPHVGTISKDSLKTICSENRSEGVLRNCSNVRNLNVRTK